MLMILLPVFDRILKSQETVEPSRIYTAQSYDHRDPRRRENLPAPGCRFLLGLALARGN